MALLKALVVTGGMLSQVPAGDTVADWNTLANKPATFPPSAHSHPISDVTGLQTALDAKLNASAYTAADVLAKLLTVDGPGSGLNADLLDGLSSTDFALASHTHAVGDITGLAAIATSGSASDLVTGTVPSARLPTITRAMMEIMPGHTMMGNNQGANNIPIALTIAQVKTELDYTAAEVRTTFNPQNGAHTFTLADVNVIVRHNNTTTDAYTIPPHSAVNFPTGSRIFIQSISTGTVILTRGAGVSLFGTDGTDADFRVPGINGLYIECVNQNTWIVVGRELIADQRLVGNVSGNPAVTTGLTDAQTRAFLGLGTAALQNIGTSGATVPLLNTANSWAAFQTISATATDLGALAVGSSSGSGTTPRIFAVYRDGPYDDTTRIFEVRRLTSNSLYSHGNLVWHAGNDGASSGLDADLVDGLHASSFALTSSLAAIATSGSASDLTAGTLPDARLSGSYTNLVSLTLSGVVVGTGSIFEVRTNSADGADNKGVVVSSTSSSGSAARGAYLQLYGNEHASFPGRITLASGASSFFTAIIGGAATGASVNIYNSTADGSDDGFLYLSGGGSSNATSNRGGYILVYGNEHATQPGVVNIAAGATGTVRINNNIVGTATFQNIGTSGANVPVLNATNQWDGPQTFRLVTGLGNTPITVRYDDDGTSAGPQIALTRISASPAASDGLGLFRFDGRDDAGNTTTYGQLFVQLVSPVNGAENGRFLIQTMQDGAFTTAMTLAKGVLVGAATGGDKGVGTVNATAVYDDNVLLTCMPLQEEFIGGGEVDLAKWDAIAPNGHHPVAHLFDELVRSGVDPRRPSVYVDHMLDRQSLPGMPSLTDWTHGRISTGEMINRLWLALEMLAVAWMHSVKLEVA